MVNLGPAARRLDDHESVQPMCQMIGDHWRRAVVDINAGVHGFELKNACGAGRGLSDLAAAAWPEHAMRVDTVADRAFGRIFQREFDRVPLAHANPGTVPS
jgi:hypothetical protein